MRIIRCHGSRQTLLFRRGGGHPGGQYVRQIPERAVGQSPGDLFDLPDGRQFQAFMPPDGEGLWLFLCLEPDAFFRAAGELDFAVLFLKFFQVFPQGLVQELGMRRGHDDP